MADISHHQFIALLKKSNVIDAKKLQPWLDKSTKIESARKLAKSLVQQDFLTSWQAKFLLSGRYRLRIGNYFLLSRLRRDELGARYLAIHATLNRKVELQIFSRDLTSDTKRWKDMIKKATLVAELDHPALVHVYDIDHDDDRYFLVVEHAPGRSLDAQKEIFTTPQIGKLILQCAEGVQFAHQNNVVHGTIDQSDVILTDKGTVKLQNLTVSPMRNQNNDAPEAKPIADFKALAKLGKKLMSANPGSDKGSGADLVRIFAAMKADGANAMTKLKQWVEAAPDTDPAINVKVNPSGAKPIFSSTSSNRSKTDSNNKAKVTYEPDAPDEAEAAAASSSASIVAAAKASPSFLAACGLGLVMFLGIATYGISRTYSKMVTEPAAKLAAAEMELKKAENEKIKKHRQREKKQLEAVEAKRKKRKAEAERRKNRKNQKPPNKSNPQTPKTPQPPASNDQKTNEAKNDTPKPTADTPEAEAGEQKPNESLNDDPTPESDPPKGEDKPNKFLDIFGQKKKKTPEPTDDAKGKSAVPKIAADVDPNNLTKLTNIGPATQQKLYQGGVKTYKQISEMTPAALDELLDSVGANKIGEKKWTTAIAEAKSLAEEAAELAKEHFRKVPDKFKLPPIDSTKPVELTKLNIPTNYLLSIELISPEGISQRPVFLELNEDTVDEEKWIVSSKKNKNTSNRTDIATFEKTNDTFIFAWTPEAAIDKAAPFLKNSLIRLSTPDGRSCVCKLRKPNTAVRSLRINKDKLFDTVNVQLDSMPHIDNIKIQLSGLRNPENTITIANSLVTSKKPGLISLRRSSNQFIYVQVTVKRTGTKLKLSAALVFNEAPIKSASQLVAMQQRIESQNANAQQRAQGKSSRSPEQQQARLTKRNVDAMADYQKSISWLFAGSDGAGQAIDFEISANFDDGTILLAKSNKKLVDKSKQKKK